MLPSIWAMEYSIGVRTSRSLMAFCFSSCSTSVGSTSISLVMIRFEFDAEEIRDGPRNRQASVATAELIIRFRGPSQFLHTFYDRAYIGEWHSFRTRYFETSARISKNSGNAIPTQPEHRLFTVADSQ